MLSVVPAPPCEEADADDDAELPDADLSSESPKSRECRVSVLLYVESMVERVADRCCRLSGSPMTG